ncbi:hypothetical protein I4641_04355 [Waterburya agarophytonicola K14]|uniref:Uncharacterized protein n=1 Tax=Waterburya agarophytonicola KI4 TaxID=2874699 RepID=A0A964BPZ7_9CYAN|nr:hypothetical protein [Waterburya agarophytonicola]MCC0176207.1 hypothetical protein [Waterburya agarophytonicola KI4]
MVSPLQVLKFNQNSRLGSIANCAIAVEECQKTACQTFTTRQTSVVIYLSGIELRKKYSIPIKVAEFSFNARFSIFQECLLQKIIFDTESSTKWLKK